MKLYLSRLRIARNPQVSALAQLLNPSDGSLRMDAHHRLLWSAFSGTPQAQRDFLWRHDGGDGFLVLSPRTPVPSLFFETPEVRDFAPLLQAGDQLTFALRANATRTHKSGRLSASGKPHKAHIDLVMDALHPIKRGRAEKRMHAAQDVATRWMELQGSQHGFAPDQVLVSDYSVHALPAHRGQRQGQPQFGVLELTGLLTVTDPATFLARLPIGFGRAKAFGCGLMLIRRT